MSRYARQTAPAILGLSCFAPRRPPPAPRDGRRCPCSPCSLAAAPAPAVATIAADTTRAPLRDALGAGRSPTLVAGVLDRTLLRFRVAGLRRRPRGAAPVVIDPTSESVQVRTVPAFAEDAATPAILLPSLFAVAKAAGAQAGHVGAVGRHERRRRQRRRDLQVSGPLLDPAMFSSARARRAAARRHAGRRRGGPADSLLDPPLRRQLRRRRARPLGRTLDGLEVIDAAPAVASPVATSASTTPCSAGSSSPRSRRPTTCATGRTAPTSTRTLAAVDRRVPGGGFVVAVERARPTPNGSACRTSWSATTRAGPRSARRVQRRGEPAAHLAPTAEGTPELRVLTGAAPGELADRDHDALLQERHRRPPGGRRPDELRPATWAPRSSRSSTTCSSRLGTRGNLGDRADDRSSRAGASPCSRRSRCAATSARGACTSTTATATRRGCCRCAARPARTRSATRRCERSPMPTGVTTLLFSGYVFAQGAASARPGSSSRCGACPSGDVNDLKGFWRRARCDSLRPNSGVVTGARCAGYARQGCFTQHPRSRWRCSR